MLAQHQTVNAGQIHIEGITGGGLSGRRVHIIVVALCLGVDGGNGAAPGLILIHPGTDDHRHAFGELIDVLLTDAAFDPVVSVGQDGDISGALSSVWIGYPSCKQCLQIGDGLHGAVHSSSDGGAVDGRVELVDLRLFRFDVVFRLGVIRLQLQDLSGEPRLVGGGGGVHVPLQLGDLGVVVGDGGVHPFNLQLGLLNLQLGALGVVGEQRVPLGHMVSLCHHQFAELLGGVELHILCLLGLDDAAVTVGQPRAGSIDIADGLDVDAPLAARAAPEQQPQCYSRCGQNDHSDGGNDHFLFPGHGITSLLSSHRYELTTSSYHKTLRIGMKEILKVSLGFHFL